MSFGCLEGESFPVVDVCVRCSSPRQNGIFEAVSDD